MDDLSTVKRLHYFDHQFLRADDFTDEQSYHVTMRRLHNQLLHSWGIADGLDVAFQGGATSVTVGSGVAIDSLGREVVLSADHPVELVSFPADKSIYLTIAYDEQETDESAETGASGKTRTTEQPKFAALQNAPGDPSQQILLAVVSRTGTEVTGLDKSGRRAAGTAGGSLDVLALGFRDPNIVSTGWVRMRLEAANRALLQGSLHISAALDAGGNVTVAGDLSARSLGWGLSQLSADQGGSIELGGNNNVAGTGTPYIDFHFNGKKEDYNARLVNDADHQLTVTGAPVGNLRVTGDISARSVGWAGSQLVNDQGGSIELGGNNSIAGTGAPYIDFHFNGKTEPFNARLVNDGDGQLTITGAPVGNLRVTGDISARSLGWAGSQLVNDQGGSIELGGNNSIAGTGTPYIDFHFNGKTQDFNVRVINDADGQLTISGKTRIQSDLNVQGRLSTGAPVANPVRNPSFNTGEAHSAGPNAGWSFANRDTPEAQISDGAPGTRWVLYSAGGLARLWSGSRDLLTLDSAGMMTIQGRLFQAGGKQGYVTDQFVNNTGASLQEGDVVVIASGESLATTGLRDSIPVPEVDPASDAYDRRVCGIVSEVFGELVPRDNTSKLRSRGRKKAPAQLTSQRFSLDILADIGHAEVKPGQVGEMVTLGAFSHCNVDADIAPIEVGDLLTTSPTRGHAQKVLEPERAIGAIVAKSLAAVPKGKAKIPVIVLLQ